MPNVGTITGSMYLDPSAYISGLNTAAGATRSFQQGVSSISFAGFNRGIFATTTLLYGLERIMSNMSKGMEEYANMLGRIGTVADLTAASVSALAESMAAISVHQGVSRKDIMGGMYTAAQAGYQTPAEMRAMATQGAKLSRASGKEIDVKKSVDLMSGIRQALGVGADSVTSGRMTDVLLRGRDIGRWELDQMAHALGIPLTVWGNQYAGKQSGEETLRQLLSVMSVASLAGVSPNMTATGTRRIVEKTITLANSGKKGDPLRQALRGVGYSGADPIMDALNEGGMKYLNTLMNISGNGQTSELGRLGYGARDLLVLTSALRGKGAKLNEAYQQLSYGAAAGTTERYGEKMRQTYDYSRERLRAQWEITSQQFMQATVPLIGQFTTMLEGFNKVAQSLPESVKSFMMLMAALSAARLFLNFFGFRTGQSMPGMGGAIATGGLGGASGIASKMGGASMFLPVANAQAARLARNQAVAAGRPYSRYLTPQASPMWGATSPISGSAAPNSLRAMQWMGMQPRYGIAEEMRIEALRNRYAPMTPGGIPVASSAYGPSIEQRIRWAAYKQGQSVNFNNGSYGSLSPTAQAYFATRGGAVAPISAANWGRFQEALVSARTGRESWDNRGFKPEEWKGYYRNQWQGFGGGMRMMAGQIGPSFGAASSSAMSAVGGAMKNVTGSVMSFGSAIMSTLGPLAKFAVVFGAAAKLFEGFTYRGSEGGMEGGFTKWASGGGAPGLLSMVGHGFKMAGSFARNGTQYIPDIIADYAREHGYVPKDSPEKTSFMSGLGTSAASFMPVSYLFPSMRRRIASSQNSPLGLQGYRPGNANDAMGVLSRENLGISDVRSFAKGGIDFSNFKTAEPYVKKYISEQLNPVMKVPDDWNAWFQEDFKNRLGIVEDALKFFADVIKRNAQLIEANRTGAQWMSPWSASVSSMTVDAVARQRLLSGKQWDIYNGADYFGAGNGTGNGGLNWDAGNRDYRQMYRDTLTTMDQSHGDFAAPSYSAAARSAIAAQRKAWDAKAKGVGAKFGGFTEDPGLEYMLGEGDKNFRKNRDLRDFLEVLPDFATMTTDQKLPWFTKLTGRTLDSDVYAKANFDNFSNMNLSDFISTQQTNAGTQYAQATQFGTAEGYNQLLQRDNPNERMVIALDKLGATIETFKTTQEQVDTELEAVAKKALDFFKTAESSNFFENINDMATVVGD